MLLVTVVVSNARLNDVPSAYTDLFRNNFKEFEEFERSPLGKRAAFERKDGSVVMGRIPSFISKGSGVGREIMNDEAGKPSKFARKNCFFSPVQCSFYYKRNAPLI
uniref:Uncharacterized protein n=1 Tax=Panagrolaimus sp. ES5 TaxID=591445 RepID=A0AC34FPZ2_9BILA